MTFAAAVKVLAGAAAMLAAASALLGLLRRMLDKLSLDARALVSKLLAQLVPDGLAKLKALSLGAVLLQRRRTPLVALSHRQCRAVSTGVGAAQAAAVGRLPGLQRAARMAGDQLAGRRTKAQLLLFRWTVCRHRCRHTVHRRRQAMVRRGVVVVVVVVVVLADKRAASGAELHHRREHRHGGVLHVLLHAVVLPRTVRLHRSGLLLLRGKARSGAAGRRRHRRARAWLQQLQLRRRRDRAEAIAARVVQRKVAGRGQAVR
mmetsp:Transcript_38749/g.115226  ORF Transcript_38749/g.115226 Transcript_38749/m.115226 type:complete len:261 (+) Transcript_38749:1637-2419(+)